MSKQTLLSNSVTVAWSFVLASQLQSTIGQKVAAEVRIRLLGYQRKDWINTAANEAIAFIDAANWEQAFIKAIQAAGDWAVARGDNQGTLEARNREWEHQINSMLRLISTGALGRRAGA